MHLIYAISTEEDQNLLRANRLASKPKGLLNQAATANMTASNDASATNIESDFKDLINGLG